MAPKVQLLYFDGRGRGEIIRMILSYGGVEFEDKRVKMEEWPQLKPSKNISSRIKYSNLEMTSYFSDQVWIHARVDVG